MKDRVLRFWLAPVFCVGIAGGARAADTQTLFAQAVAADLGTNGKRDAALALSLYAQAADAGMRQAQLNVAVLLDAGREVPHDAPRAATYYGLAASQGEPRAAYNLGQLYADGEGVPRNADVASAWLKLAAKEGVSAAPAFLSRLNAAAPAYKKPEIPVAPTPIWPASRQVLTAASPVLFVWTAPAQPVAAQFFVEVAVLEGENARDVFTATVNVSAVAWAAGARPGRYAWRVFTVCQSLGQYAPSPWNAFSVG